MKKLITLLLTFLITVTVNATENVQVFFTSSLTNSQGNMVRTILENANKNQSKYNFILISRQGANGLLAINAAQTAPKLSLLAASSAYYITPLITSTVYDVDEFVPLTVLCVDRPMAFFSKKISKLESKHNPISMGGGFGYPDLLVQHVGRLNPALDIIHVKYKTSPEATFNVVGGHLDVSIDFMGSAKSTLANPGMNMISVTGPRPINGIKPLPGTENFVLDIFLFAPKSIDPVLRKEFNQIFNEAHDEITDRFCESDFGIPTKSPFLKLDSIHSDNKAKAKILSKDIQKSTD